MTLIPRKYSAADSENWTDKCGANRRLWVSCLAFGSITNVTRLSPDPRERLWKRLIILFVLWRQRSLLRSNVLWHFSGSDRLSAGTSRHTKKKKKTHKEGFFHSVRSRNLLHLLDDCAFSWFSGTWKRRTERWWETAVSLNNQQVYGGGVFMLTE